MANQYFDALSGTAAPRSFGLSFAKAPPAPAAFYPQTRTDGSKPKRKLTHKCPWQGCDRWLSCPHHVQQHIREAHTGEKPYQCIVCERAFTRPWGLYRHLRDKHGIVDAAPGRGRGGGLERLGVEGMQKRKKGWRAKGSKNGEAETPGQGQGQMEGFDERYPNANAFYGTYANVQPPPQAPSQSEGFDINNFAPIPTACRCGAQFDNREALLVHLHIDHGEPSSPLCNCMLCLGTFQGDVDAAGVHVQETGAVAMRGLRADDLFRFDEGAATTLPGIFQRDHATAPAAAGKAEKAAADREAVKQASAGMGMTEEQFTANMPKPAPGQMAPMPFAVDPATGGRLTAGMPQARQTTAPTSLDRSPGTTVAETPVNNMDAIEFEDVEAWLKSAEEVFSGVDEVAKYSGPHDVHLDDADVLMRRFDAE